MRATIKNPGLASTYGINTEVVYTVSWILSGGLAGISGALLPFYFRGSTCLAFILMRRLIIFYKRAEPMLFFDVVWQGTYC